MLEIVKGAVADDHRALATLMFFLRAAILFNQYSFSI